MPRSKKNLKICLIVEKLFFTQIDTNRNWVVMSNVQNTAIPRLGVTHTWAFRDVLT